MDTSHKSDLSIEDVEFLQAVRHIEQNPDDYESVIQANGRATTQALNRVLQDEWDTVGDWSRSMISYRLNKPHKSEGSREWGVEEGFGLVKLHDAELKPEVGWTSRSVELTEKGRKRLSQREQQLDISRTDEGGVEKLDTSMTDLDVRVGELESELAEVKAENEELREKLSNIAGDVNTFKDSDTGALSTDVSDQLEEVFNRMVIQSRLNHMVFEIDPAPFSPPKEPTEEDIRAAKESLQETLLKESEPKSVSETDGEPTAE